MSDIDPLELRRKRLKFRSWHRGTREADLILGPFADAHLDRFDETQVTRYEKLLEESDPDIYNWLTEREMPPAEHDHDVLRMLMRYNTTLPTD